MATPQLSPGLIVREVDLTVGRADNVLDNIGAIAGPFELGPVNEAIDITTEQELINSFGKPLSTDRQYEYWMTASSYLSYGGVLKVARVAGSTLGNSNAGAGVASTSMTGNGRIDNYDDYQANHTTDTTWNYAAKNPGKWANNLKVCVIDNAADQTIGINTTNPGTSGALVGNGVTVSLSGVVIPGAGTTSVFNGYLKGIITGVTTDATSGASSIDVKIVSRVSGSTETKINYQQSNSAASIAVSDTVNFVNNSGINTGTSQAATTSVDWYDQQSLGLTNSTVFWKSIAPRPVASNYVTQRKGGNDGIHVVVVDDTGSVTGIQGNILEKFTNLSKAVDATSDGDAPTKTYYKNFVADNSAYIYAGKNPSQEADTYWNTSPLASGFSTAFTPITTGAGLWGLEAQGVTFSSIGSVSYTFTGGVDYSANGGMEAQLGDLNTAYDLFSNKDEIEVAYVIMGPGLSDESQSQAKANKVISIAEARKDCVATVSPHRANVVNVTNTTTATSNLLRYYSPLTSSSYAVFDSGYKYTFDRFNNEFRYIPCNGDVAGLMTRTNLVAFPWFSPAGTQRGTLNNAIKLAYNPTKAQRDQLYPARVNSIINQKGSGIILFGDKTGLGYASAFDRINVRRLFLTVEQALEGAANSQLFELNDSNTRSNFVNIVEPYLRDVQAKRGVYDFLIVCDDTNNTPEVIDNNEFRADIYLKPTKSINFVTLTFIATRTGVQFSEVAGRG
jgi:hypothetical protein